MLKKRTIITVAIIHVFPKLLTYQHNSTMIKEYDDYFDGSNINHCGR